MNSINILLLLGWILFSFIIIFGSVMLALILSPLRKRIKEEQAFFDSLAHEIWASAQLMPNEGIEDGVYRITKILHRNFKQ